MSRPLEKLSFDLASLRHGYETGAFTPAQVIEEAYARVEAAGLRPIWISLAPRADVPPFRSELPLSGIPFAVKDNIDVAGMETTAACPEFAFVPDRSATVVELLEAAGAVPIGKTNLDQFATGLVGVRSPYGACGCVFDDNYISGGSSSGSAVAVARGMVGFALGTDTAGSGRVPAAFNNLVGLKPTRGLLSTSGVLPACRTLDCVSIFAADAADAAKVFDVVDAFDAQDPFSRQRGVAGDGIPTQRFRFGAPQRELLEFFGDSEAESLYWLAVQRLEDQGGVKVEIDFQSFRDSAELLYAGPWVSERLAAISSFAATNAEAMHPVVREIILGASRYTAVQAFEAQYKLADLLRKTEQEWQKMDVLVVPTAGTIYTKAQVEAEPIRLNTNLGYYTNFVNLLDLAAVAIPAGFRSNGLPFGVTLIGPALSDRSLLRLAGAELAEAKRSGIEIAVVGAHLSGMPLNTQITDRGAQLVRTTRTNGCYRLYSLAGTAPPKPGLIRSPGFAGPGIEVEVWTMPIAEFGSFIELVPPPLSIGTVLLADGSSVKCFLCEPYAVTGATDITEHGGWRAYIQTEMNPVR